MSFPYTEVASRRIDSAAMIPADWQSLSRADLRELDLQLPEAFFAKETIGQAVLTTYVAKDMFDPQWNNPALRRLAVEARKTYGRYGERFSVFDKYEPKAVHFLTRVEYPLEIDSSQVRLVEWHSLRFIPPAGDPPSTEDIDFYICGEERRPLFEVMSERLPDINGNACEDVVITQSRLCIIHPFILDSNAVDTETFSLPANKYTALAFAMNTRAVTEYLEKIQMRDISSMWMTSQMWEGLLYGTVAYNGQHLDFQKASEVLDGYGYPIKIQLDRNRAYAYEVPSYFLNWTQLISTLNRLASEGKIKIEGLDSFPEKLTLKKLDEDAELRDRVFQLGQFLTSEGPLSASNLTGEGLRNILDQEVIDQPILWLARLPQLRQSCTNMIQFAQQTAPAK